MIRTALSVLPGVLSEFAASSSLLKMSSLARSCQPLLESVLEGDDEWHFEDRVLVLLVPDLEIEAARYYEAGGPALGDLFSREGLRRLDNELAGRLKKVIAECLEALDLSLDPDSKGARAAWATTAA